MSISSTLLLSVSAQEKQTMTPGLVLHLDQGFWFVLSKETMICSQGLFLGFLVVIYWSETNHNPWLDCNTMVPIMIWSLCVQTEKSKMCKIGSSLCCTISGDHYLLSFFKDWENNERELTTSFSLVAWESKKAYFILNGLPTEIISRGLPLYPTTVMNAGVRDISRPLLL